MCRDQRDLGDRHASCLPPRALVLPREDPLFLPGTATSALHAAAAVPAPRPAPPAGPHRPPLRGAGGPLHPCALAQGSLSGSLRPAFWKTRSWLSGPNARCPGSLTLRGPLQGGEEAGVQIEQLHCQAGSGAMGSGWGFSPGPSLGGVPGRS